MEFFPDVVQKDTSDSQNDLDTTLGKLPLRSSPEDSVEIASTTGTDWQNGVMNMSESDNLVDYQIDGVMKYVEEKQTGVIHDIHNFALGDDKDIVFFRI